MDLDFETEEWGIFRSQDKTKSSPIMLYIDDISMHINVKVLAGPIPRNPPAKIVIPYQNVEAFDWMLNKGGFATASGQFRLQNNPTKAVLFLIREDASTQLANPFDLLDNSCTEVEFDLNGKRYTIPINKSADSGDDADLYYETFRALGPNIPVGKWFIDNRHQMFEGMFMVPIDLTKSGMINQLDTLDMDIPK